MAGLTTIDATVTSLKNWLLSWTWIQCTRLQKVARPSGRHAALQTLPRGGWCHVHLPSVGLLLLFWCLNAQIRSGWSGLKAKAEGDPDGHVDLQACSLRRLTDDAGRSDVQGTRAPPLRGGMETDAVNEANTKGTQFTGRSASDTDDEEEPKLEAPLEATTSAAPLEAAPPTKICHMSHLMGLRRVYGTPTWPHQTASLVRLLLQVTAEVSE